MFGGPAAYVGDLILSQIVPADKNYCSILVSSVSTDSFSSRSYSSLQSVNFSPIFHPHWDEATDPNYLHGTGKILTSLLYSYAKLMHLERRT